jgi:hypothetical protein
MKMVTKAVMTLAVVAVLAVPAMAATDKLIVNNGGGAPVFKVDDAGTVQATKIGIGTATPSANFEVAGTVTSTGSNAVGAVIDPTLVAGVVNDSLYGLKISPTVNANGFANPLLYSFYIPGSHDGIIRLKFDNTNVGVNAQSGIEMNNNVGQALITFYGSNYTSTTLRNFLYYKNAVGGMKFLANTGASIGFGLGTTAAEANSLTIDASKRVVLGNVPGPYADNATALSNGLTAGTLYRTNTGALMVVF